MGRHAVVFAPILVVLALIAGACGGGDDTESTDEPADACPDAATPVPVALVVGVVSELADEGAGHARCDAGYSMSPPASGEHFDAWQNCGFYTDPVRDHTAVHALEHGAVWIAYSSDLGGADLDAIEADVDESTHLLAAPYPGLQNPIVLTAWRRQVAVDTWEDPLVTEFLSDFVGRVSSTAPEAGASCEGAVGSPPDDPDASYDAIVSQMQAG